MWNNLRNSLAMVLLLGSICVACRAQSPLSQAFVDMKSSDQATAQKAKDNLMNLMVQEMPNIERDTATLCGALKDSDSFIRLQATAVLQAIAIAAPTHNQVVLSCVPGLIANASDSHDRVRNNALFILAMNPAGPPPEAQQVFEAALQSSNFRTVEVGAAGLLKMDGGKSETNQKLVEKALKTASDPQRRLNMLYAISGSGVHSDPLFVASQEFIADSDQDVQHAAIDAVATTGKDPQRVIGVMQSIANSASTTSQSKQHAEAILKGLQN